MWKSFEGMKTKQRVHDGKISSWMKICILSLSVWHLNEIRGREFITIHAVKSICGTIHKHILCMTVLKVLSFMLLLLAYSSTQSSVCTVARRSLFFYYRFISLCRICIHHPMEYNMSIQPWYMKDTASILPI